MGWPQLTILFFCGLQVVTHICLHGQRRTYNGPVAFVDVAISLWLLWMGGFFA